ncbi:hypothetical protein [Microbacterium sp.]|uniref:hypothetical protein n=1 Tax=Microbacterium sp. TaxID=51671 RepID=UPI0028121D3D|nr:hypothetical protein [Microbacterium sp.]
MNADDRSRFAAGETGELPPAPPQASDSAGSADSGASESDIVRKDMSYSPASETETQQKQRDPLPETLDDDIDPDDVRVTPGTGGPDDVGDVEVDPDDLNMPGQR